MSSKNPHHDPKDEQLKANITLSNTSASRYQWLVGGTSNGQGVNFDEMVIDGGTGSHGNKFRSFFHQLLQGSKSGSGPNSNSKSKSKDRSLIA
jgi:hypothetical protein